MDELLDYKNINYNPITAQQKAKSLGVTMTQVRDALGQNKNGQPLVSLQTLNNWHKNKPALFEVVCLGVKTQADQ